jgi:hypothetical protein
MAIRFRETRARFRDRPRFLGLDTGPVPIAGAAVSGVFLLTFSYRVDPSMDTLLRLALSGSPLVLTVAYIWAFKTGRRPSLDRDLFMLIMNGKSASPLTPAAQPLHPAFRGRSIRMRRKR